MTQVTPKLLSPAEYSRHRGCSRPAVTKALRAGRITATPEGKIDPIAADAQWLAHTRPRATMKPPRQPAAAAPEASPDAEHITYIEAKRRQAVADMRHSETELQRQAGALVWLAEVVDEYTKFLITARESFMQLPGRLVPLLVADPTPAAMDRLLHDAIAEVLRALAQHPMVPTPESEGQPWPT